MYEELFSRSGLSLERLKTLCEIADRGGISKAAEGDPVKQSQFSRQLRELETFFDVALTRRRGRNAELTSDGEELATLSREVLTALGAFAREKRGGIQTVRIGSGESLLQWNVLPRLKQLRAAMPNTVFSFRNLRRDDVIKQLQETQIDFGLMAERPVPTGIRTATLGVMRYRIYVRARSGATKGKLRWQEVLKRPFVGLEGDGQQMRTIRSIAARHGVDLAPSVLCSSLPNVAMVLGDHEGFAVLPEAAIRPGLVAVDAPFLSELERTICLAWNERRLAVREAMERWRKILTDELTWRARVGASQE
jgi:DNA-binding transcriptional LysR family regulator